MKALSLTALTVAAYLILTNLFGTFAGPSRKSLSVSSNIQSAPESAPATGYASAPAAYQLAAAPETAQGTTQTAIDAPTAEYFDPETSVSNPVVDVQSQPAAPAVVVEEVPVSSAAPAVAEATVVAQPMVWVEAPAEEVQSAELEAFTASVVNGQPELVVGVYAEGVFSLPVVQQPAGQPNYVATEDQRVTQFAAPQAYGTVGLLAHNYLSGKLFFNLAEGQELVVVYGDGQQQSYRIAHVQRYQALDPLSAYSNFIDTADPSQTQISAATLFSRVYGQPDQLVLQTCIEANGDFSWGRLFITAEKVN